MNIVLINQIINNSENQLHKFSEMTVECSLQLLEAAKFLRNNTEIYKSQIKSSIDEEKVSIELCEEIIKLSDNHKHRTDILKYKRDIEIHRKNIKRFQDILLRIGCL